MEPNQITYRVIEQGAFPEDVQHFDFETREEAKAFIASLPQLAQPDCRIEPVTSR